MNSRQGKDPPVAWVARFVVAARELYPGASLTAATVQTLLPAVTAVWRQGGSPELAAQTLCQCRGGQICPTKPATPQPVRGPRGAKRGQAFGVDDVRPAPPPRPRAPRAPRPPRGATCPPGQQACKLGVLGGACGLPAVLVLARAQGVPVPRLARYCLLSAEQLIPSHDPLRGFRPRPEYPSGVQERDYQRDRAEQLKVLGIAQNLIPELVFNGAPGAIDGLPVVTEDAIVLGGNGRSMALQLHYAQGGHVAADYLRDHGGPFGFSRAQVEAVERPVVVRVIETEKPLNRRELQELVRVLNIPLSQALDIRSESVAEAQRLSPEIFDILATALAEPDSSLRDYLSSRDSRTLAAALRRAQILTDNNAKRYLTVDSFSEDGKTFVERLLTAALVPDAALLDRAGPQLLGTLARSAPWLLSAAAAGADWDLRPALVAAVRDLHALRRAGAPSVDFYLRQSAIEPPAVLSVTHGPALLQLLFDTAGKPLALARFARRYAELAAAHPSAQGGLFAAEKLSPAQALEQALSTLQKG